MGLDWKSGVFLVLVYSKTARRHVMTPSEVASAHWPLAIGALRNPSWSLVPSYHRGLYTHALSSPGRTKSSVPLSDPPPCAPANGRPGGFPFGFLGSGGRRLPKARRGRVFIAQYACAILLLLLSHKFRAFRTNSAPTHRAWVGRPRRNQLHAQGARAELLEKNPPGGRQK